jgi:pSer/pThr/pTyr-binding forkhead associated (FHA) protein
MPQLIASVEGVETHHVYLHKDSTTLGRRAENDIVLADLAVSGRHCAFEQVGLTDVYVVDLGSTNGTYIDGRMVRRHLLQDGDQMTIGKFKILYRSANELTDESHTVAMPLELSSPAPDGPLHASLRVLSGSSAGLEIPVVKAVATFGKPGVAVVAIAHRRQGYFISCMEAADPPTLNGQPITDEPILLLDHDVLDLAGTSMEFSLQ